VLDERRGQDAAEGVCRSFDNREDAERLWGMGVSGRRGGRFSTLFGGKDVLGNPKHSNKSLVRGNGGKKSRRDLGVRDGKL